ncbi:MULTISPECIES: RluA family pseudouridine synthase [Luteimonas]|uniref:RluA family pseudouridine synthase n=1 Tax=Luteimonas TaxID=83614 RepID=UPI0018EC170D|nr:MULTISPECIES: pseudouridine synthase [Luteimonas]
MPHAAAPHPDVVPECLQVLHADAWLLAFDKPSGLLSVPGRGADKHDSMATRAQAAWPDARVVHRLDMATSGVIVLARGEAMQRALGNTFADRGVDKRYEAVVDGWVTADTGEIDLPLASDWPNRPKQRIDRVAGKPSQTRWQVRSRGHAADGTPCSRLTLIPWTGRTHQLRVHLQAIGHPILGDALYADPAQQARAPRLLLHATSLALIHPGTGQPLLVTSPTPF